MPTIRGKKRAAESGSPIILAFDPRGRQQIMEAVNIQIGRADDFILFIVAVRLVYANGVKAAGFRTPDARADVLENSAVRCRETEARCGEQVNIRMPLAARHFLYGCKGVEEAVHAVSLERGAVERFLRGGGDRQAHALRAR